jgi:hypothetical protein
MYVVFTFTSNSFFSHSFELIIFLAEVFVLMVAEVSAIIYYKPQISQIVPIVRLYIHTMRGFQSIIPQVL